MLFVQDYLGVLYSKFCCFSMVTSLTADPLLQKQPSLCSGDVPRALPQGLGQE